MPANEHCGGEPDAGTRIVWGFGPGCLHELIEECSDIVGFLGRSFSKFDIAVRDSLNGLVETVDCPRAHPSDERLDRRNSREAVDGLDEASDRHGEVANALERDRANQPDVKQAQVASHRRVVEVDVKDALFERDAQFVHDLVVLNDTCREVGILILPRLYGPLHLLKNEARHLKEALSEAFQLCDKTLRHT